MRELTSVPRRSSADALVDHLLVHGIEALVRGEDPWQVWVVENSQLEDAKQRLAAWSPEAGTEDDKRRAAKLRQKREREDEAAAQRAVDPRRRWETPEQTGLGPLTITLCIAAALVGMASDFGDPGTITIQNLSIEPWASHELFGRVRQGEIWRLITPMFIHFGVLHLAFNVLWLWRLGQQIEHNHGFTMMVLVVLASEIPSSIGQYLLVGPNFGGLSGVVYGVFGFVWMYARYDRRRGYAISDRDSVLIMLWFVACATGLFGPIANIGHAGGLIAGLLLGLPPYVRQLRAQSEGPKSDGNDWASVHGSGARRIFRRVVTPYVPLWFMLLAIVVIAVD
ncbi:MAG: rhomboid family intramembrane serine protease [Myxococcota bacterium]